MQTYVDNDKLAFVPNPLVRPEAGADTRRLSPSAAPVILTVANLTRVKAHDVLLEAFARLSPELSNWRLALVGAGEEEQNLRGHAKSLGIAEGVDWYGRVADPSVFYRTASIFVLPSRYEGMPNALMEAMSYGLPAVVSNASPGPLDLVKDGETGLVVPVDDPFALANAVELLANNGPLRKRLGDAGRKRVSEYDLPKVMPLWERVIATAPAANQQGAAGTGALRRLK
jgi:glycosyltransferase involved in cell wall biosynthesis